MQVGCVDLKEHVKKVLSSVSGVFVFFCNMERDPTFFNADFNVSLNSLASARTSETAGFYFELALDQPLGEQFDSNFYIDEPLPTGEYMLVTGVYELNPDIGEFGGYRFFVNEQ